jgi:hypothetical protein
MIKLTDLLKELTSTPHYQQRKLERGNILDIILPKEAYGDYNIDEAKSKIIQSITSELNSRLQRLENADVDASKTHIIGYKILKPILVSNNKDYSVNIKIQEEKGENTGTYYYGIINDGAFVTFILEKIDNDADLENKMLRHLERENKNIRNKKTKILTYSNFDYKINLDELFGKKIEKEIPTEDSVDYTVRTDYRKGTEFNHKTYGKGVIITASTGNAGKGDANGRLDWVEVDFGKPYLKGGQLMKTRKISPIYTKVYFDTQKKKTDI